MSISLRTWLTLILVAVNLLILGTLAVWFTADVQRERDERVEALSTKVRERFSDRFEPERAGDIARMLDWPWWGEFEDAVILDRRVLEFEGQVTPVGAFLNPAGRARRSPEFPMQEIAAGINDAMSTARPTLVGAGLAVPLYTVDREIWGGVFVQFPGTIEASDFGMRVLWAAAVVTLVGAGLFYLLIGRAVIRPVEQLGDAALAFGAGGQPDLPDRARTREIEKLRGEFVGMMARIRGFRTELESEVEQATERAQDAERHAARQDRLAALGTLAAGLAHEINSPLAGAMSGVETLRGEAQSERAQRHGALTSDALERIGDLVRRLLRLAPTHAEAGECSVQEVLDGLPTFVESRLERHQLTLDLPTEPLRVRGSIGDLFPVMLNLVHNALDALDAAGIEKGRIEISAVPAEPGARVVVADNGPGADPELLPHLFEPFVTDKDVGKGTGLGLALAYATVRELGGEIEARNAESGGLEVVLHLAAPEAQA